MQCNLLGREMGRNEDRERKALERNRKLASSNNTTLRPSRLLGGGAKMVKYIGVFAT